MSKDNPVMFETGQIVMTQGVRAIAKLEDLQIFLSRHLLNDWGDLDKEDIATNNQAVKHGSWVLSAYHLPSGNKDKIWIITEADRSVTTILLPEEY